MAVATKPAMSAALAGMISVLLVLARLANARTYSCATFRFAASIPPFSLIASATARTAAALASAISRSAVASPWARLMAAVLSPSDLSTAACFSPSATLISCWRSPSDLAMSARFSRSAVICACIARRMVSGGVMLLIS